MNWTMIGALGEMIGAIAVVASLLYVGRQVSHNAALTRAQILVSAGTSTLALANSTASQVLQLLQ